MVQTQVLSSNSRIIHDCRREHGWAEQYDDFSALATRICFANVEAVFGCTRGPPPIRVPNVRHALRA